MTDTKTKEELLEALERGNYAAVATQVNWMDPENRKELEKELATELQEIAQELAMLQQEAAQQMQEEQQVQPSTAEKIRGRLHEAEEAERLGHFLQEARRLQMAPQALGRMQQFPDLLSTVRTPRIQQAIGNAMQRLPGNQLPISAQQIQLQLQRNPGGAAAQNYLHMTSGVLPTPTPLPMSPGVSAAKKNREDDTLSEKISHAAEALSHLGGAAASATAPIMGAVISGLVKLASDLDQKPLDAPFVPPVPRPPGVDTKA